MRTKRAFVLCSAAVALALGFGRDALTAPPTRPAARPIASAHVHTPAFFDPRTFALALTRSSVPPRIAAGIRAVIVPHHWLAADLIVEGLRAIDGEEVRRVILVGPNHTGAGGAPFTTSRWGWRVRGGTVRPDTEGLRGILAHPESISAPQVLQNEHSVAGLVPAVSHFAPRATIVPLVVRARTDTVMLRRMAQTLAGFLRDPHTVLVASVDFSHYLSASEAVLRNRESIEAIRAFDVGRIIGYGNEHMDSPPTIALLLETLRIAGADRFELWHDRNSTHFGGPSAAPNVTSYIVGAFR